MASSSSSSPELPVSRSSGHNGQPSRSIEARLHEVLEDLSSRFILNLPEVELASLERVCFQVEQAHWYYEDFVREQDPSFPTMTLKKFSHSLFHVCPLLSHWGDDHEQTFQSFLAYKTRVPVCGAIMLNETWDKCLLVKGWKATSAWSFPKGKINEQEPRFRCAAREVLEETGYDLGDQINPEDVVELSIRDQSLSLYIVPNVPEDFPFETRTRKEISKIAWFRLTDLPTWRRNKAVPGKFYLITPFIGPLKAFLRERKSKDNRRSRRRSHAPLESDTHLSSGDDGHPEVDVQHASHTAQESSSQSSADLGDPQTPSPLYSEPVVHTATGNDEANTQQTLNLDTVDPHFARLLTSLSLSASASSVESMPNGKSNGQPPPQPLVQPSLPPHHVQAHSSSSSRSGTIVPARPLSTVPAVPSTPSHQRKPSQVNPSPSPSKSSAPEGYLRSLADGVNGPSKQSPMVRRSTADISPYLQRAAATPAIPKQIKYISMLESVAKESERMTPKLERQMAIGAPSLPTREQLGNSGSLNSMYGIREESPVIYSSGPGPSASMQGFANQPALPSFNSLPSSSSNDPFTVRPHTSNAYHAPYPLPSTRPSYNEEQLQYMMSSNGVRRPNGQPMFPPGPYPATRMPAPQPPPFAVQQPFPPNRGPNAQPNLRLIPPQQLLPSAGYGEPGPLSAPVLSPGFNFPRTNPPNPTNNAHLLSILNAPAVRRPYNGDPGFVTTGPR